MSIDLTEFWTSSLNHVSLQGTIISEHYMRMYPYSIGCNKLYTTVGNKFELKAVVEDNTIYLDFSANTDAFNHLQQQAWILKHVTGQEYKIERCSLWEKFNLPSIEQLNEFAKIWHTEIR